MPYRGPEDLPATLQRRLPPHAREIYCSAFNRAWASYRARPDRETVSHKVAWAAVRRQYRRQGNSWVARA